MNPHLLRPACRRDQVRVLARADRAAAVVDRAVRAAWDAMLGAFVTGDLGRAYRETAAALRGMQAALSRDVEVDLADAAVTSYRDAAKTVAATLPTTAARSLVARSLSEDDLPPDWVDRVFPPPSRRQVLDVLLRGNWRERIASVTRLAGPDQIAGVVASAVSQGKTAAQIGRLLQPVLQGVQSSVRRVVRTEAVRVIHEVRLSAWDRLPADFLVGYEIHATLDARTRPEHKARDGTIYYRNPKPGQHSTANMPHPPLEADGTVAFNCRCWLSPVLAEEPEEAPVESHVLFPFPSAAAGALAGVG